MLSVYWGVRMDLVVVAYLMVFPTVLMLMLYLSGKGIHGVKHILKIYIVLAILLVASVTLSDIPYYHFYTERISSAVFLWLSTPDMMWSFVKGNFTYLPFFLVFLVLVFFGSRYLFRKTDRVILLPEAKLPIRVFMSLGILSILFVFMRGGIQKRPIMTSDGFKQSIQFYNHLSANPVLYFAESLTTPSIDYMPYEEANVVSRALFPGARFTNHSPISREVVGSASPKKFNVIMILVESLGSEMVGFTGGRKGVSKFLDSMANNSMAFTNCFSTGVHTFNGIYGSLYGLPTLGGRQPMADQKAVKTKFTGLPGTLQNLGYHTSYICTHELRFDNCEYFLGNNGFSQLISVAEKVKNPPKDNSFGVGDEYLFDFAFKEIGTIAKKGKPFFSTILTISTHGPHKMGNLAKYKPQNTSSPDNVYEYTDNAIKEFVNKCKTQDWYSNTVFVILGDHGFNFSNNYEIPLKYVQIPLLIFGDSVPVIKYDKIASQIDVYPTVMGILGQAYVNNSFGVDLQKSSRNFAPFSKDFIIGMANEEFYFLRDKGAKSHLFNLRHKPLLNIAEKEKAFADSIRKQCESMMRTTQFMIENKMVE